MPTKYPHDPDFPFLVIIDFSEERLARFLNKEDAHYAAKYVWHGTNVRVIDTTPKPRIPVDAQFITWGNPSTLAIRETPNFWKYNGMRFSETELLAGEIQSARIIVLDPRPVDKDERP